MPMELFIACIVALLALPLSPAPAKMAGEEGRRSASG